MAEDTIIWYLLPLIKVKYQMTNVLKEAARVEDETKALERTLMCTKLLGAQSQPNNPLNQCPVFLLIMRPFGKIK
jgi:hypothetical protein